MTAANSDADTLLTPAEKEFIALVDQFYSKLEVFWSQIDNPSAIRRGELRRPPTRQTAV